MRPRRRQKARLVVVKVKYNNYQGIKRRYGGVVVRSWGLLGDHEPFLELKLRAHTELLVTVRYSLSPREGPTTDVRGGHAGDVGSLKFSTRLYTRLGNLYAANVLFENFSQFLLTMEEVIDVNEVMTCQKNHSLQSKSLDRSFQVLSVRKYSSEATS